MPVDKLVIDRAKWGRKVLLDNNGNMCCLGHLSAACGVLPERLLGNAYPSSAWLEVNEWARDNFLNKLKTINSTPDWGRSGRTPYLLATELNDGVGAGKGLSDSERETALISLFKENGVELSFIGSKSEPELTAC